MNGNIAVRLENVSRAFGKTAAVNGISLDIAKGEIVSLVGHSGCGKSTLLRIISGVEPVDSGRVFLDGCEVDGQHFVEPEARGVGFVFQDYALFPHLSVRDNILFGLKHRLKVEAVTAAENIIRRIGIEHLADRFPHTLSGGEQQRVALARALAPEPAVILMDEPFSNLDQGLRDKVRTDTLSLLRSLSATAIMVTHDPQEALSVGDRVVLMRSGEIVQAGNPYDLHDRPENAYAAEFFCAFNKVSGQWHDGKFKTVLGSFAVASGAKETGAETLYIRPRDIIVSLESGDLPARIGERVFYGDTEQLVLFVDGLETPLKATVSERLPDGTEKIRISVRPERLSVF
ncbi:ATP-binding cassette domain-containing protein [Rhizobiales bacterium RZME27]|uniref:ATP-binding cassette domain-containing protein n=1 Tax=Endobacterium cereale TaxID=2663029 RepID=A0A6A8A5F0_9HYPH|nr:ABC transporter ATP-binding protein [Endobacterium cereale]MEB2843934.1 ABC transporter ATP-binding protein [Endobacterium cereale]MQY46283.1 ATP-binding cassette domain-containing protein [Endobacterium cereale]